MADALFKVAVIHGGPGVPGEMAPVAIVSFPRKKESIYLSTSYSLPPEKGSKAFCV